KQAEKALKVTYLEAKMSKSDIISTEHLLLAILRDEDNIASRVLRDYAITYDVFKSALSGDDEVSDLRNELPTENEDYFRGEERRTGGESKKVEGKSKTPVLDNFGRDLTKAAEDGKLDPIVGREKEIERVSQVLSRRKKNNPVLIGEPGVGK